MLSRLVVTVSLLVATTSSADAQPAPRRIIVVTEDDEGPAPSVRVDVGVASPIGIVGVVVNHPFVSRFAVEAGAGYGLSGFLVSCMLEHRRGSGRWTFTPGLGFSIGLPVGTVFHAGHPPQSDTLPGRRLLMKWFDADLLGVEYRSPGGFVFAASGGLTVALNDFHWDVGDQGDDVAFGSVFPQLRLGVGRTF